MIIKLSRLLLLVAMATLTISAHSLVMFEDNFNSENGGNSFLNYTSFDNWVVSHGTVDIVNDNSNPWIPNNIGDGIYVDMDGSSSEAGRIRTRSAFLFEAGSDYRLSFDLAGNNRNFGDDSLWSIVTSIGIASHQYVREFITLSEDTGFTTFSYEFGGLDAAGRIVFDARHRRVENQDDNIGLLLDNIVLERIEVSEPGTIALFGLGLLGLAASRRRQS